MPSDLKQAPRSALSFSGGAVLGMFYLAVTSGEPPAHFLGVIFEWPVSAFVGNAAVLIEYVQPLRPCSIGIVRGVAHLVDPKGYQILVPLGEIVRDGNALLESLGLRVAHIVFLFPVRLHLPLIG